MRSDSGEPEDAEAESRRRRRLGASAQEVRDAEAAGLIHADVVKTIQCLRTVVSQYLGALRTIGPAW